MSSSNVASGQYDAAENYLNVGFKAKGNTPASHYGYHNVSPAEADDFAASSSPGGWVWDHLRVRGSATAHQKPYSRIAGPVQDQSYGASSPGFGSERVAMKTGSPSVPGSIGMPRQALLQPGEIVKHVGGAPGAAPGSMPAGDVDLRAGGVVPNLPGSDPTKDSVPATVSAGDEVVPVDGQEHDPFGPGWYDRLKAGIGGGLGAVKGGIGRMMPQPIKSAAGAAGSGIGKVASMAAAPAKWAWNKAEGRYGKAGLMKAYGLALPLTWAAAPPFAALTMAMTGIPMLLPPGTGPLAALPIAEMIKQAQKFKTKGMLQREHDHAQTLAFHREHNVSALPEFPRVHMHDGGTVPGPGHDDHTPGHALEHSGHIGHDAHDLHELAEAFGSLGDHASDAIGDHVSDAIGHASDAAGHGHEPHAVLSRRILEFIGGFLPSGVRGKIKSIDTGIKGSLGNRYGAATTGAMFGAGSLVSGAVRHAIGLGEFGAAIPGQSYIGGAALLPFAEIGKQLGLLGPGSKVESGLHTAGGYAHGAMSGIGSVMSAGASRADSGMANFAHAFGKQIHDREQQQSTDAGHDPGFGSENPANHFAAHFAGGGRVGGRAADMRSGGFVPGAPGIGSNEDNRPILTTEGEHVTNKAASQDPRNKHILAAMDAGQSVGGRGRHFRTGGVIYGGPPSPPPGDLAQTPFKMDMQALAPFLPMSGMNMSALAAPTASAPPLDMIRGLSSAAIPGYAPGSKMHGPGDPLGDQRDNIGAAFARLNEFADQFPGKIKQIDASFIGLQDAAKKFQSALADTSGTVSERGIRIKAAAANLQEKLAAAGQSPVRPMGDVLGESLKDMLPGLLKGAITGVAYQSLGPVAGMMAYSVAGAAVQHLEHGGHQEKGGIAEMAGNVIGKVGGWFGIGGKAGTGMAGGAQGPVLPGASGAAAGAGGIGSSLAAAAGPVGLAIGAAMLVNSGLNKVGDSLHAANSAVAGFATGMAQTLGIPPHIAELGGAVMTLFSPLKGIEIGLKAMQFMIAPLLNLDKPGEILKEVFMGMATIGAKLVTVMWDLRDPAAMLTSAISPFVSQVNKFNPGIVSIMNLAFDNLSASAGRIFEPIIIAAGDFADELNQLFTGIAGPMRGFVGEFIEPIKGMAREFAVGMIGMVQDSMPILRQAFKDLQPVIQDFGRFVITASGWVVRGFGMIVSAIGPTIQFFRDHSTAIGVAFGVVAGAALAVATIIIGPVIVPLVALGTAAAALVAPFVLLGFVINKVIDYIADKIPGGGGVGGAVKGGLLGTLIFPGVGTVIGAAIGGYLGSRPGAAPGSAAAAAPIQGRDMTYAAQPSRHVGIEDVGLEARRSAFSQGSNHVEMTATNTAATATNTAASNVQLAAVVAELRRMAGQGQLAFVMGGN